MAATDSATGTSSFAGGWLSVAQQNATIGYPDNPEWPGPVSENHGDVGTQPIPGRDGLSGAPYSPVPEVPGERLVTIEGGNASDTVGLLGHSAPVADFDSNAGDPFAPMGAIADTHGYDTGGTDRTEQVPVPHSPGWFRRVMTGQTWNRQAQVTTTEGWAVSAPNDRQNLNQDQGQNADAYDPFTVPYSERPIKANYAHEAVPVETIGGPYGPDGNLADMAGLGGQGNYGYTSPPDPAVTLATPAGSSDQTLGMEYVSG